MLNLIKTFFFCITLLCGTAVSAETLSREEIVRMYYQAVSDANTAWYTEYAAATSDWYQKKSDAGTTAFNLDRQALEQFRNSDRETYLQYLDAREWNDSDRINELSEASPPLASYLQAKDNGWKKFLTTEKALWKEHEERQEAARVKKEEATLSARAERDAALSTLP